MLASGAGRLVPFDDPAALADGGLRLHRAARDARRRAGGGAADRLVARLAVGRRGDRRRARARRSRSRRDAGPPGVADLHLTSLRTDHLLTLVDDVGIVQHAHGIIPNRDSGYCVDDVARLAVVSLALAQPRRRAGLDVDPLPRRSPSCTRPPATTGMRNFMSYDRRWLDEPHVGDHVGRSVWALGEILATAWIPAVVVPGARPARPARRARSPATSRCARPRTRCSASRASTPTGSSPRRAHLLERLVEQLADAYERTATDGLALVRGRAQLRQRAALAGADQRRRRARPRATSRSSGSSRCAGSATSAASTTTFCACRATAAGGGTSRRPGRRRRAAARRRRARRGRAGRLRRHARAPSTASRATRAFEWFLGRNRLQKPLYDFATGGCSDGLGSEALNDNEGAESTLAFHRAALLLDAAGVRASAGDARARAGAA